jgi:hypothetical protein
MPSTGEWGSKGERLALNSRDDSRAAFLLSANVANELIFFLLREERSYGNRNVR